MKWEYLTVQIVSADAGYIQTSLTTFGSSGWELVAITAGTLYIFKRRTMYEATPALAPPGA